MTTHEVYEYMKYSFPQLKMIENYSSDVSDCVP